MGLSALLHGVYEMWPNFLTSVLFPVNESIWEHGKLILSSFLLLYPIDRIIFKEEGPCFSTNIITSVICIMLTYLIFTPIFFYILKTNDNIVVTLIIYFLCIVLSLIVREKIIRNRCKDPLVGTIVLITLLFIYTIVTFNPIRKPIFYDYKNKIYGIRP